MSAVNASLGQLMMIGLSGKSLSDEEGQFIVSQNIGGVILFDRNLESPEQIHELCRKIQELGKRQVDKSPLFIAIDMEGGRVHRLKAPFTHWPAMSKVGLLDSTSAAFKCAQQMGAEMRAVGINLDFAPCIDVLTNPANTVIGDRALGSDPELVSRLSSALVRGFIKSDIIACAKHFPGHGDTLIDSHNDLPVQDCTLERLENVELTPFKKVFRARLDMVMTAHIRFPHIDPEWPVTLSEIFLKRLLRENLRFRNLIITDDLDMKALTKHYERALIPVRALAAGADLLLYCNDPSSPPQALESVHQAVSAGKLDAAELTERVRTVLEFKRQKLSKLKQLSFEEAAKIVGHPDHVRLAKGLTEGVLPADLTGT